MIDERHTDADEAPHAHSHGVRSSVVERPIVNRDVAGSNPVARPNQPEALYFNSVVESFVLPASLMEGSGPTQGSPSVAQSVERRIEAPSCAGSSPARGTKLKL